MKKEEKRYRTFMLILYEEDNNFIEYINYIVDKKFKNKNYKYLGITHDRDTNENGEIKKSHDHIVLYFDNPRTISSISKELGLPSNYIESYKSLKTALTYLIHFNQGDKAQYSIEDTYGDLQNELKKYTKNVILSEEDRVLKILDLIDSYYKYTSYSQFLRDICSLGLYDILRRNNYMFLKIFDKHNERYYNNN